ncbi:MAG: tRNA 2-thiouridine(34) synthase MnmA [Candidatus Omnitrophica bacterium]|nr:tRNA 2-thiouridine(34) synthase MnmA [Candidatus Omnitrophota bacterium]
MKNKRVLVAMSGGVDSSVAAAILKDAGCEVIGATMKIWPKEHCEKHIAGSCCSSMDIEDAKKVCASLDVRHYTLDFEKIFREEVIDYFTREYLSGRTPNPCIVCNEKIKFGALLKKAEELGCDFIATGHYARIEHNGSFRLKESADKNKDQSYVLFSLRRLALGKILFPIGGLKKEEVKVRAREIGLSVHAKKESQEICFVIDGNYADFIKEHCKVKSKTGDIVDVDGNVLGRHKGFWNFTIGQRKGLGIAHKNPLYVTGISADKNLVVVGGSSETKKKKFIVKDVNWFCEKDKKGFESEVKIRYNHKKAKAFLKDVGGGNLEVDFEESQTAITPGQAAVFYEDEYVVGGGWIDKVTE